MSSNALASVLASRCSNPASNIRAPNPASRVRGGHLCHAGKQDGRVLNPPVDLSKRTGPAPKHSGRAWDGSGGEKRTGTSPSITKSLRVRVLQRLGSGLWVRVLKV